MATTRNDGDTDNRGSSNKAILAGNAWCCTASIITLPPDEASGGDGDVCVQVQKVNGYGGHECSRPFVPWPAVEHSSTSHTTTDETRETVSQSQSSSVLLLDLTTSPDWMQYIEFTEDRQGDEGGAGAYDTLRCDLILVTDDSSSSLPILDTPPQTKEERDDTRQQPQQQQQQQQQQWRIWGRDFHLQRLEKSFASLVAAAAAAARPDDGDRDDQQQPQKPNNSKCCLKSGAVERAIQDSHVILDALLAEAAASPILKNPQLQQPNQIDSVTTTSKSDVTIQLIKFTWLWSLTKESNNERGHDNTTSNARDIVVRGHACSSAKPMQIHGPMTPIIATIAARATRRQKCGHDDDDDAKSSISWSLDTSLPTRHGEDNNESNNAGGHDHNAGASNPQQKVASWTRMRQKMEHGKDAYKPIGFPNAEVLMVRKAFTEKDKSSDKGETRDELEILEGLSSNFFAIYKNGTIKTATKGVLHGYARQLVLDIVEEQQINNHNSCSSSAVSSLGLRFVDEPILLSESSEWVETFITSSSRLIYPISRVLMHTTTVMPSEDDDSNRKAASNNDGDDMRLPAGFEPFWIDPVLTRSQHEHEASAVVKPKWQIILHEILSRHGY